MPQMNEQLSLFQESTIYPDLQHMFLDIEAQYGLQQGTISLKENFSQKGKNAGALISADLIINEPEYPTIHSTNFVKSSLVMKFIPNKSNYELLVPIQQYSDLKEHFCMLDAKDKADKVYQHVVFDFHDTSIFSYIESNIRFCIDNYTSSNTFGCCSRYSECSLHQKCLHPNKLYAKGCLYRKNLETGKIFY